ncbi:MAG: hypothetical protein FWF10_03295 [Clostridiales bacterium]|nr:hypothetical protein [Clostridiales bacterium]
METPDARFGDKGFVLRVFGAGFDIFERRLEKWQNIKQISRQQALDLLLFCHFFQVYTRECKKNLEVLG